MSSGRIRGDMISEPGPSATAGSRGTGESGTDQCMKQQPQPEHAQGVPAVLTVEDGRQETEQRDTQPEAEMIAAADDGTHHPDDRDNQQNR